MSAPIDATGRVVGRLTALDNGRPKVKCSCECGNIKYINRNHFLSGNILSCGCLHKEIVIKNSTTHGKTKDRLYSIWSNMKSRCYNKNVKCYEHYGGKGISVCEQWMTFEGFLNSIPDGYDKNLELDRIDNQQDYKPSNCRWVDRSVQNFNKSNLGTNGVSYIKRDDLWRATITRNGERFVKHFKNKKDALLWRNNMVDKLWSDIVQQNRGA